MDSDSAFTDESINSWKHESNFLLNGGYQSIFNFKSELTLLIDRKSEDKPCDAKSNFIFQDVRNTLKQKIIKTDPSCPKKMKMRAKRQSNDCSLDNKNVHVSN
jgi:hypothetical protein